MKKERIPTPGELRHLGEENGGKWFLHCRHNNEKITDFHTRQNPDFPELIDLLDKRTEVVKATFFKSNGRVAHIMDGIIQNPKQGEKS